MKFVQALELLNQGKKITSPTVLGTGEFIIMEDEVLSLGDGEGVIDNLVVSSEVLEADDFIELNPPAEMFGYYNREKGRWMSTSNPDKVRAQGFEVVRFVAAR